MTSDSYWHGTWLSASMIARPAARRSWTSLVRRWDSAGLLGQGEALLLAISPEQVTYGYAQDPEYLPAVTFGASAEVLGLLEEHALSQLMIHLGPGGPCPSLRIDSAVNPDESVAVTLSAPLSLFDAEPDGPDRVYEHFLDVACRVFSAEFFLAGTLGEEARIGALASLYDDVERWTGRAFYGHEIAATVAGSRPEGAAPVAGEWLELRDDGLYVSWGRWPKWLAAPAWWCERVRSATETLRQ